RYGMPISAEGELFMFADLAYRSRISFFLYQSREFTDASLVELGLRVGYTRFDGSFEAALFSRNLNNDLSRTGGIDFNNLTGFVNEPRTFGAEMRFTF
ncbi:MAG: TonB-dependent receptor, partial [Myxococcota bacterium]